MTLKRSKAGTHITKLDTRGKMKRKVRKMCLSPCDHVQERHEAELSQIEKAF